METKKKAPKSFKRYIFDKETMIFLVEALILNTKIHEDIDDLYRTKSKTFHDYAVRSGHIEHPLIVCGSINHEEYGRRALGILQYAIETNNKNTINKLDKIIKKGWPEAYYNVSNYKTVNIESYIKELQNACMRSVAGSMAELFVFYCMCIDNMLPIVSKAELVSFFTALAMRSYIHTSERYFDAYNKKSEEKRRELDTLRERVINDYGITITPDNQIIVSNNDLNKLYRFAYRLVYTDKVEMYHMFKDIQLEEKDINDILCAYHDIYKDSSNDEAGRAFLSGLIIKLLVKSIIGAKDYYFRQTAEQAEMYLLEQTVERVRSENKRLISENERRNEIICNLNEKLRLSNTTAEKPLLDRIRDLEKQNAKLQEALRQEQQKERELSALREFFFNMENRDHSSEQDAVRPTEIIMDLKDTTGAIIGGNPKWSARMKELLPKWVFILSEGFDKRSLEGIQTIFFLPNNMSHALYYKAVAIAKTKNMDIGFIYNLNEQLALKAIAKVLAGA